MPFPLRTLVSWHLGNRRRPDPSLQTPASETPAPLRVPACASFPVHPQNPVAVRFRLALVVLPVELIELRFNGILNPLRQYLDATTVALIPQEMPCQFFALGVVHGSNPHLKPTLDAQQHPHGQ